MKHLTIMLKPASSLCNLRCKYCFYADITSLREVSSFGVMKESAMTAVMDHIFIDLDDGDYLTLSFQGGEPMLAGLPFYRNLVQYIAGKKRNIHINYTLQTNGILLDDDWCKFLAKYGFRYDYFSDVSYSEWRASLRFHYTDPELKSIVNSFLQEESNL